MSTDSLRTAHDDVLAKMDALLKRHHDRLEKIPEASPELDFPVLMEEVHVEEVIPVLTEVVEEEAEEHSEMNEFPFLLLEDVNDPQVPETSRDEASPGQSIQALENLDRQILDILDQRLSGHVASAIDRAMAAMLDQFSVQLESVVREAVAEELRKQLGKMGGHPNEASD